MLHRVFAGQNNARFDLIFSLFVKLVNMLLFKYWPVSVLFLPLLDYFFSKNKTKIKQSKTKTKTPFLCFYLMCDCGLTQWIYTPEIMHRNWMLLQTKSVCKQIISCACSIPRSKDPPIYTFWSASVSDLI